MSRHAEEWRDIPGYSGLYQASDWGRIRSFMPTGKQREKAKSPHMIRPAYSAAKNQCYVSLVNEPDKREAGRRAQKVLKMERAVFLAFHGEIPEGMVVSHRNGDAQDNRLCNLALKERGELSREVMRKKVAGGNRIPVLKIDRDLNILEAYSSESAAARANGMNASVIRAYCLHIPTRSVFAPDGFIYALDDERHLRKTLERAKAELDALGEWYNDPGTERYYDLEPEPETSIDPASIVWEEALPIAGGGILFQAL